MHLLLLQKHHNVTFTRRFEDFAAGKALNLETLSFITHSIHIDEQTILKRLFQEY